MLTEGLRYDHYDSIDINGDLDSYSFDLNYNFSNNHSINNSRYINGNSMFIDQAIASFNIWFNYVYKNKIKFEELESMLYDEKN